MFKVSSENACGKEYSAPISVSLDTITMSPVTYRTEGCGVRFDWEDNPEAVEYQIQIDG